jgi:hypothetical protein
MADQTAAASSPAEVDVFAGKELSFEEFSRYRKDPEKFTAEPAETAPADAPKEAQSEGDEPESAGESEAPKETQEKKPHLTAEQRVSQLKATIEKIWSQDEPDTVKIAQLEATIDKIEARSGAKQRKTEPAPVAQPPQVQAQPQYTRPEPTAEDKNPDGTAKYDTYEQFVEALADWEGRANAGHELRRELCRASTGSEPCGESRGDSHPVRRLRRGKGSIHRQADGWQREFQNPRSSACHAE